MNPKVRSKLILEAAITCATKKGFRAFSRQEVATAAGVSDGLVSARLGSMEDVRSAVMREAIKRGLHQIVLAGLVEGHRTALRAPAKVKEAARKLL